MVAPDLTAGLVLLGRVASPADPSLKRPLSSNRRYQRDILDLVEGADGFERQLGSELFGDVIEIGFVLLGKDDRFAPARGAPRAFSLKPPMGSTRPRSVTSPVRAARADSFTPSPIYPVRINGIVGTASWGRQLGVGIPPVRTLPQT